jgi:hypothetical protein
MSAKNIGAALLAAAASVVLATAVPAHADPTDDAKSEQIDQVFLKAVKDEGLKLKSDGFAVDLAHSTCDVLTRTGSVDSALRHIQNATDWSDVKKMGSFGSLAIRAYCPSSMPKQ